MLFDRTYGVEIEFVPPEGITREQAAQALREAGLDTQAESWNHQTRSHWKLVTDSSIDSRTRPEGGWELISPPLRGSENGFRQINLACRLLDAMGASISKKCGLHVHVDVRRPTPLPIDALKRLALLYAESEEIIDMLVPPSRRKSLNQFCRSIAHLTPQKIADARDATNIARAIEPNNHYERYVKLSFTSYYKYGTVEFRHHAGTIDGTKIRHWVLACLRMVDTAENERDTVVEVQQSVERTVRAAREGSKNQVVYQMLTRPEGCTTREVLEATGWAQASVAGMAKSVFGLELRQARVRENGRSVYRYWGALPSTSAVHSVVTRPKKPESVEEFAQRLGMTDDERIFWTERAQLFAHPSAVMMTT